jgi:hypothetical protein
VGGSWNGELGWVQVGKERKKEEKRRVNQKLKGRKNVGLFGLWELGPHCRG